MSFFNTILSSFFGNKSQRDIKELTPMLERVKQEYLRFPSLTNDELRAESTLLRAKINNYIKAEEDEIASLKEQAESGKPDKAIVFAAVNVLVKRETMDWSNKDLMECLRSL